MFTKYVNPTSWHILPNGNDVEKQGNVGVPYVTSEISIYFAALAVEAKLYKILSYLPWPLSLGINRDLYN